MKQFVLSFFVIFVLFFNLSYPQTKNKTEKENVESVAKQFLNSASKGSMVSSNLIAPESLDKFKEGMLSMALSYDSTGKSNAMMLLPADSIKSMSSAQVWEFMRNLSSTMKTQSMNVKWKLEKTEIKNNNNAFVTYDNLSDGNKKVMQLKKINNKWKVVLNNSASIF